MNNNEFSFVAGLHGNELAPYFALCDLGLNPILGNPRAAFMRKRFVDRDLNASFGLKSQDYETIQANSLLRTLPDSRPVIDFHTFSCASEPFVIIVDRAMLPLASRLGIKRVVLMSFDIKSGHSLITHRSGVSVEVGQHDTEFAYSLSQEVIRHLHSGESIETELYQVTDIIRTSDCYNNFIEHPLGFIPVLSGESAYEHFGLKSTLLKS